MPKAGVRPNVVSCNAAIKACGDAGQWQHALAILRGMPNAGVSPNAVTYNSAIAALGIAGQNEQVQLSRFESTRIVELDTPMLKCRKNHCLSGRENQSKITLPPLSVLNELSIDLTT